MSEFDKLLEKTYGTLAEVVKDDGTDDDEVAALKAAADEGDEDAKGKLVKHVAPKVDGKKDA